MGKPFIFRKVCVNCPNRKGSLFSKEAYVNCVNIKDTQIGVIIPGLLWYVSWCKLKPKKIKKKGVSK